MAKKSNSFEYLPPIHLACSSDELRENLTTVFVSKGIATATDANMLVRYDLRNHFDADRLRMMDGKMISRKAWAMMAKHPTMFIEPGERDIRVATFNLGVKALVSIDYSSAGSYPDYANVLDKALSPELREAKGAISMNGAYLERINKILNHDLPPGTRNQLAFYFNQSNGAIAIVNHSNDDACAILMPIHSTPEDHARRQDQLNKLKA